MERDSERLLRVVECTEDSVYQVHLDRRYHKEDWR